MMRRLLFLFLMFVGVTATAQSVKWTASVKPIDADMYELRFMATISDGLHIYDVTKYSERGGPNETVFSFVESKAFELVGDIYCITKPNIGYDETFKMEVGTFGGSAVFGQKIRFVDASAVVAGTVEWQACRETTCLMPEEWEFSVKIDGKQQTTAGGVVLADITSPADTNTVSDTTTLSPTETAVLSDNSDLSDKSLWGLILEAALWGLAALLTPCVFPMLPMTVSFFMKNGGRRKAILYGICIVALYVLPIAVIIITTRIVGGATITADIFNYIATHWLPNIIFFTVFMLFAASFFGAFEIVLPSRLANKTDAKSDKGGLLGVLFMAMTLVLVSFSCTGPLVGNVLIRSTAGEFWTPIITIAVFATVFALPFVFFAMFPSLMSKLPKSGGWLNTIKVVLGFVELALGLKFLSVADQTYHWGLLDREIYLALWIVIFALLGLYLLGKLHFKHDSPLKYIGIGRLVSAIASFAFVVYLLPGMWGAPLKGLSGYLPPLSSQDFVLGGQGILSNSTTNTAPRKYSDFLHAAPLPGLDVFFDYTEAIEYAEKINKPLLLDFTGAGCVSCREMESRVWSDNSVLSILSGEYVLVEIYLDDKKNLPESDWVTLPSGKVLKTLGKINSHWARENYNIASQPTYIVVGYDGKPLLPARGYNLDINGYVDFLKRGVDAFRNYTDI